MLNKKIGFILVIIFVLNSFIFNISNAASQINDLSETHFSYNSVVKLISLGILSVDSKGNFYPEQVINKFDFSKIVAKMLGYQDIDLTKVTSGETTELKVTNKFAGLIGLYEKKFTTTWDKTANLQVAYLLEKGILEELDLAKFVVEYTNGEHAVRNLTKQEIATWIVRVLGKRNEAIQYSTTYKFTDDAEIEEKYKADVYYLYGIGLFKGDDKGNFSPKSLIKKNILATLLDRTIQFKENNKITSTPITNVNNTTGNTTTVKTNVKLYSGELEEIYDNNYAIKIKQDDGVSRIATLDKNVEVYKDNVKIKIEDIKKGNLILCADNYNGIIKMYITSLSNINTAYSQLKAALSTTNYEITEDTINVGKTNNTNVNNDLTTGRIVQIVIGDENKVTIENDNKQRSTYKLVNNSEILIDNIKKTIYDLRLGHSVGLTSVNSDVTKITISSQNIQYSIRAKIKSVNSAEKYITVIEEADNAKEERVYIEKDTSIFNPADGEIITITGIKVNSSALISIVEQPGIKKSAKSITLLAN